MIPVDPYRSTQAVDADEPNYSPRVMFEGPLYPNVEHRRHARVRVVRVHVQRDNVLVTENRVEVTINADALGVPRWIPLEALSTDIVLTVVAALAFRLTERSRS